MKIKDIAKKLEMTPKLVRRFIRSGKIKATKDEKGHWFSEGELPTKESLLEKPVKEVKIKATKVKKEKATTTKKVEPAPKKATTTE